MLGTFSEVFPLMFFGCVEVCLEETQVQLKPDKRFWHQAQGVLEPPAPWARPGLSGHKAQGRGEGPLETHGGSKQTSCRQQAGWEQVRGPCGAGERQQVQPSASDLLRKRRAGAAQVGSWPGGNLMTEAGRT